MAGDTAFLWSHAAERGVLSEAALLLVVSEEAVMVFNSPFDNVSLSNGLNVTLFP